MKPVRLATRGSDLALAQARLVAGWLRERCGREAELLPVTTTGDRMTGSLARLGGKGLFVKEIEEAVLAGRADVAVHSAKDLPAALPDGLALAAFPERGDPRDALVTRAGGGSLAALPRGARVATGSLRRAAQLLALRADLEVVPMRGNVGTRLRRLETDDLDAVVLACAGLERLGLASRIDERIAPEHMLPAVAQGILALEVRRGDPLAEALAALNHAPTEACARAERGVLVGLGADCTVPLAAHAELSAGGELRLRALLADPSGAVLVRAEARGSSERAAALGAEVARTLLAAGGAELLARLRDEEPA
jgi:hydroxymethylbilane synthase